MSGTRSGSTTTNQDPPPRMLSEHLWRWLAEAQDEDKPYATHWLKVVDIVQMELRDFQITYE